MLNIDLEKETINLYSGVTSKQREIDRKFE